MTKKQGEFHSPLKPGNPNLFKHGEGYASEMRMTEDLLTPQAKTRRRLFVAHYIRTTNASAAATFAGFKAPAQKGNKLLREPYVQNLMHDSLEALDLDAIMTQREVLFRFKEEANNHEAGNQGARISALAHIAKIHGMLIDRQESKVSSDGGVMIVPAVVSVDDWGEMASQAQAKLKETARD